LENPYLLHARLIVQQAVFLCPGDVGVSFEENLRKLNGYEDPNNLKKVRLALSRRDIVNLLLQLRRMNVTHAVLFPGPDGFAKSLSYRLPFIRNMAKDRALLGVRHPAGEVP
jgi:hypothetical protein